MERSGSENLVLDDEVFQELSPIEFRYPETNSIDLDLGANYLLDNPSGTTIHSFMDVQPDPTVASESDILTGQAGESGLLDQELTTQNLSPLPDQGTSEANSLNLLSQEINSSHVPSQEMTGMSFTNLLTQGTNPLNVPGQETSELGSSSFPTQNINSLNRHSQELSMMDFSGLPTQGASISTLGYPNQVFSMMNLLNLPTQVTYVNTLELSNRGSSMMDTFGRPTQESFTNILEFPNQNLSRTNALSFSAPHLTSIGFMSHEPNMNTSRVPYLPQPVFMPMENNMETAEMITISSSDDEQFQEDSDPNEDNGDGASGSNSNSLLRQSLSKEMISQYFHLSLTNAARALNVGKTLLKTRCRELDIKRWPQRKFKSLRNIIAQLQASGEASGSRVGGNVQERIRQLENERKRMEDNPDLPLEDDTIRLRQTFYKSSHKKRKQSDRDH